MVTRALTMANRYADDNHPPRRHSMAKHSTHKDGRAARAETIRRRKVRATRMGRTTTRSGREVTR